MHDEWMTTSQVGQLTGIPEGTWRYWKHRGEGPRCYKVGRRVLYKRTEVDRWLEAQAVEPLSR